MPCPPSFWPLAGDFIFTKLLLWTLVEYDRLMYLDADAMALPPGMDEVLYSPLVCPPAAGGGPPAPCFAASGNGYFEGAAFVLSPSLATFHSMVDWFLAHPQASFPFGEQDFLNVFFDHGRGPGAGQRRVVLSGHYHCIADQLQHWNRSDNNEGTRLMPTFHESTVDCRVSHVA